MTSAVQLDIGSAWTSTVGAIFHKKAMPSLEVIEVNNDSPVVGETALDSCKGKMTNEDSKDSTLADGATKTNPSKIVEFLTSSAAKKRRHVTPVAETTSKAKQQKAQQQMMLNSFFLSKKTTSPLKVSSPKASASSSTSPTPPQAARTSLILSASSPAKSKTPTKQEPSIPVSTRKTRSNSKATSAKAIQPISKSETQSCETSQDSVETQELQAKPSTLLSKSPHTKPLKNKETPVTESNSQTIPKVTSSTTTANSNGKSNPSTVPTDTQPTLSNADKDLLQKHKDMQQRYQQRSQDLVEGSRSGLDEEQFNIPTLEEAALGENSDDEFPETALRNMAILIEGRYVQLILFAKIKSMEDMRLTYFPQYLSNLPLSKLTTLVQEKLAKCHQKQWAVEAVSTRIKWMAERKPYLDNPAVYRNDIQTKYEDETVDRHWRWEITTLEILPQTLIPKVRKARLARKRLGNHYSAIQRLVQTLEEAITKIATGHDSKDMAALQVRIGKDEEKVLKFEREAEKQRLAFQAKKIKELEEEAKRKEKEMAAEEKRKEKERKKEVLDKKKQGASEARELEKRKKAEERERLENEKKQKEESVRNKQKANFMSFFASPATKSSSSGGAGGGKARPSFKPNMTNPIGTKSFDAVEFRSLINSKPTNGPMFPSLSTSAIQSRRRRTRKVPVSVDVAVISDDSGFDAQHFVEQKVIHIPNKYRFLSFHEDCRPPYHGTWSKTSSIVTGKTPFGKDTTHLDYDYDSEAEWEEGDDEIGEDIEDDAKNQDEEDEEADAKMYDFDDGFCVADDQYLDADDNVDEETKVLYKKKLVEGGDGNKAAGNRICIIAPSAGGVPTKDNAVAKHIEGFEQKEALLFLAAHEGRLISNELLWLDAFAPDNLDELDVAPEPSPTASPPPTTTTTTTSNTSNKDDYSQGEMQLFVTFVHHCTFDSKVKLVEELRKVNPVVFASKAKATRKLDLIATKKKNPNGSGVYWEVNKDVLEELGLHTRLVSGKILHDIVLFLLGM